ncbi:PA-PL1 PHOSPHOLIPASE FAMILY [Salix viminalis]|uniref:PA-PL1 PHOSPHOLIPASE FAMILY n=1 Tax=Salix viminalis TaxID=40686 RepID=A0A9Q0Z595_SALVM|nr:PA-PL1 PHOSPHOLIPASE FAMILY [Salix viminalis]
MTETSKARVTITLGRSGQVRVTLQVVKRSATVSGDYSNSQQGAGSKRSVMDRLGGSSEDSSMHGHRLSNKRQRGDSSLTSLGSIGVKDGRIGKDDLRYKIMQKNVFRRARSDDDQKTGDLREKLSRTVQPPGHPLSTNLDARQRMPEPTDTGILGRIPPARSADDLHHINMDHLQRRPLNRAYDDVRTVSYMNKDVLDTPRSVSSSSTFMTKSAMPPPSTVPAMSVAPLMSQLPPPSGIVHKSSYAAEDQQTVEGLLHALGLGKYAILFKAEEVDMPALKQMGESDLKELGIPMGPRKKIILALLPRSKWHP